MSFQIFIRNLYNTSTSIQISPLDTIQTLKNCIEIKEGIPNAIQRLVFQGKELRNQSTLQDSQIKRSDTIDLRLSLLGGGNTRSLSALSANMGKTYEYNAHKKAVSSLVVSKDKKHIVSGCQDGTLSIFDVENKKLQSEKVHLGELRSIAVTNDKRYIISGSYCRKKSLKISDFVTQQCVHEFNDIFATSLAVTKDDKHVLCGGSDGTVKVYSIEKKKCVFTFQNLLDYPVLSIIIKGNYAICGTLTIKIISLTNKKVLRVIPDSSKNTKKLVTASDNPKYIVQAGYDRCIKVYSFASGKCIRRIKKADHYLIESIVISKNNRFLIVLNSKSVIKFFELSHGRCVAVFAKEKTQYADFPLMRITPDNQNIVVADWKGDIKILTFLANGMRN